MVLLLVSCASAVDSPQPDSTAEPSFAGPWAAEFAHAYKNTDNSLARQILLDGQISESEAAEMNAAFTSCLEGYGFTQVEIDAAGAISYVEPENGSTSAVAEESQCETGTGWREVIPLNAEVRGNPDKADKDALTADCLVRVGLREVGYSVEDYRADVFDDIRNGTPEYVKYYGCVTDPIHTS
jgi:hypothetical protein